MEEIRSILQVLGQGGLSIIIFVIWFFTFKRSQQEAKDASDKLTRLNEILIQLMKDEQEYKEHLSGILMRLEVKLSTPTQCPFAIKEK